MTISNLDWEILLDKHDRRCLCCGESGLVLTKDHVIPIVLNGEDIIENIQPLCGPCNSRKGDKIIDYRGSLKFTGANSNNNWFTIKHAANILDKSPSTIKKWIRENSIPHITATDGKKFVWIKNRTFNYVFKEEIDDAYNF